MLTNPRDALRGQSRSPNIVPFDMLPWTFEVFTTRFNTDDDAMVELSIHDGLIWRRPLSKQSWRLCLLRRQCQFRQNSYSTKFFMQIFFLILNIEFFCCGWTCGCAGKNCVIHWEHAPYLSASAVVFHHEEALYQVQPFTFTFRRLGPRKKVIGLRSVKQ